MTEARPKPLVGALLGALLALVVMALLWFLGVLPPDRLPLFGLLAVGIILVSWLLTQRMSLAKGKFIVVVVIGGLMGGVALTGIPEFTGGGSLSEGCFLEGTSSLEPAPVGPAGTSATNPFDVTTTDTIVWNAHSDDVLTDWYASMDLAIGGFGVPLWNGSHENSGEATEWGGEEAVEPRVDDVEAQTGLVVSGTYHVSGTLDAEGGSCEMSAYVRVKPDSAFSGVLLAVLWSLLVIIVIIIVIVAVSVRRSILRAEEAAAGEGPEGTTPDDGADNNGPEDNGAAAAATAAAAGGAAGAAAGDDSDEDAPASAASNPTAADDARSEADQEARSEAMVEQLNDGRLDSDVSYESMTDARAMGDILGEVDVDKAGGDATGDAPEGDKP